MVKPIPDEYRELYARKLTTPADAVASISNGSKLSVAMAAGEPPALLTAITDRVRADDLKDLRLYYMAGFMNLDKTLLADDVVPKLHASTFFETDVDRRASLLSSPEGEGPIRFVPCHFSQVPYVLTKIIKIETLVATVSPMDSGGYFSFGLNNDFTTAVARHCDRLLVEVNPRMPRVFGQSQIHVSEVGAIVENECALFEVPRVEPTAEAMTIGRSIAPLVPNGATLQVGVGGIPSGVMEALDGHEDLGIHSELLGSGLVDLVRKGIATGRRKTLHPNKHVFTFGAGDPAMYEFIDDNAGFESYPVSYVNDLRTVATMDNFISINSAIEVDLFGQVNAEFLDEVEFSGVGGQFDFVKGASLSKGGQSFIVLTSTARGGEKSRIVPRVGMVTDDRMDVEHIVTEYGVANLRGKSTRERARALIDLAHPKFRDELLDAAKRLTLI